MAEGKLSVEEIAGVEAQLPVPVVKALCAMARRSLVMEEALRRAAPLVALVTVRQVIEAGYQAIDASGLDPWCMNEGTAIGTERISSWWLTAALTPAQSDADEEVG